MKRVLLSVFSWLLPSFLTVRAADELVLFAGDVPPGPIVIYRDAPPRTLAAARMLAE
jgi:hypothetical protein